MFKNVTVVGLGGIWSYLHPIACRLMTYNHLKSGPVNLTLIDEDRFSYSNLERQDMDAEDEFKSKAAVYADRIKKRFPRLKVKKVEKFVTTKNIDKLIQDDTIVLSCVDNFDTRRLLAERARKLKNVVVISGANDEMVGNVHLQLVSAKLAKSVLGDAKKKNITRGMDEDHPEIKENKEKDNPGEMSCEERARLQGGGQTALANAQAAVLMARYFDFFLKGGHGKTKAEKQAFQLMKKEFENVITKSEVFFSLNKMVMDSTSRAN